MESETFYASQLVQPFGKENRTQYEIEETGRLNYQKDVIINSFGSNESRIYIDLYFDDLYSSLNEQDKIKYLIRCVTALINKYGLYMLNTEVHQMQTVEDYEKLIIPLMNFLEGTNSLEFIEFNITDAKDKKETNFEYLNKHYERIRDVIETKNSNVPLPHLLIQYFKYCDATSGIRTFLEIINSKPILQIGAKK